LQNGEKATIQQKAVEITEALGAAVISHTSDTAETALGVLALLAKGIDFTYLSTPLFMNCCA
jgi:hypothetical protein